MTKDDILRVIKALRVLDIRMPGGDLPNVVAEERALATEVEHIFAEWDDADRLITESVAKDR